MVRKRKFRLTLVPSGMDERHRKMLKVFTLVAVISLAVAIVGIILHGVLGALLEIEEEEVSFFIAIVGLWVFDIATIGGLVIFLKGRRKKHKGIPK